jgi:hypothetical protein
MPYIALATNDIDITVEPELYSTIVLVLPGNTLFSSRFMAVGG